MVFTVTVWNACTVPRPSSQTGMSRFTASPATTGMMALGSRMPFFCSGGGTGQSQMPVPIAAVISKDRMSDRPTPRTALGGGAISGSLKVSVSMRVLPAPGVHLCRLRPASLRGCLLPDQASSPGNFPVSSTVQPPPRALYRFNSA